MPDAKNFLDIRRCRYRITWLRYQISVAVKKGDSMPWTTEPLTAPERADFQKLFDKRLARVKARTADAFAFKKVKSPPFLMNGSFYHLFGMDQRFIPGGYFESPEAMTTFQERTYYDQVKEIDDDFVPCLVPWFGCVVMASALGCRVQIPPMMDPTADPGFYPVQTPEDVQRMKLPDPEKDGLMPTVLAFQRYMKSHSFLPVGITDCQSPLTTANQLMGYDKLIYLMADHPKAAHQLMDTIAEATIAWVTAQKKVIGEPMDQCFTDQQVYTGEHAGVWFSDDDASLMSPEMYRTFVVPYNSRVLTAFGGGCIHFCGNALHQADNLVATKGLKAFNNYNLFNLKPLAEVKKRFRGKVVLFVCDFTPVEYQDYFKEMLAALSPEGMVIDSQYSPVVGLLRGGQYNAVQRDFKPGRRQAYEYLKGLCG
jgi:uroporphyrinogen-III decarboxylase